MQLFDFRGATISAATCTIVGGALAALLAGHPELPTAAAAVPLALAIAAWGVWNRRSLRRLVAAKRPPPGVVEALERDVRYFQRLTEEQRARFLREVAWFLQEQTIEGVGVEVDDQMRALVAASAVILTFGLPRYEWQTHRHILIYPDAFDEDYVYGHKGDRAGVVHRQGPIIFSAKSLRGGFARETDGHNVGLHEFAHVLDLDDGDIDGVPAHLHFGAVAPWVEEMTDQLDRKPRRGKRILRDYGYTNAAEFFAVSTEMFFEKPDELRRRSPELHELLTCFYHQEPQSDAPQKPRRRRRRRR